MAWVRWREATEAALYGPNGFFVSDSAVPARHFRTSVHAGDLFARAVLRLARSSGLHTVVDVGAGGGELLSARHLLDPDRALLGVDLAPRPAALPAAVGWRRDVQHLDAVSDALVVANEWLDNVPVEVVAWSADGWRLVLVDPVTGDEQLGPPPEPDDQTWLDTWWPAGGVGARAEVGRPRDEAWAGVIAALHRGIALAVDYSHTRETRPRTGSLTGYRAGREVPPVPDGRCDLTSHVAIDSCAAAGAAAGATHSRATTQRQALRALGVPIGNPPHGLAGTDAAAYLTALATAGEAAELTDPHGLGRFGWLVQTVGIALPQPLTGTEA